MCLPPFPLNLILQISDILQRNKLPVIVGGTNYYIESVLYNVLVDRPDNMGSVKDDEPDVDISSPKRRKLGSFDEGEQKFMSSIQDLSNEQLHQKLKEIDPEMADILHPNNRRKIIRWVFFSLLVYLKVKTHGSNVLPGISEFIDNWLGRGQKKSDIFEGTNRKKN